ncbi:MAG: cation diffusion facilitator family transporter [Lachnospiraceae bacterium]|nr:cation diffusion facilitator family transporter [Lachnospiraceae bacterium]
MAKENAILNDEDILNEEFTESFDFDEFEEKLQSQLKEELADMQFLAEEKEKIGSPDNLGNVIMDVVWEQFLNQVAVTAGEDFIKENRGLHLDLRTEAHVQSVDNFEKQKYATHNTYVDYEARGDEYRSNFYTDPNVKPNAKQKQEQRYNEETKVWETYDNVDGEWKKTLKSDYRKPYEEDRNKDKKNKFGSKTINKDHQVADATIARDAEAGAYMTTDEKISVANSEDNLYDLDSAANQSKSDHDGEKWVKHKRTGKNGNGQTNGEYFGIDEDEYIEQDKKAKDAYEEKKKKKREEEIALGKKSQKEEAFRIGGKALQAVLMQLLAEFVREIIAKLVKWFKSAKKALETLLDSLKEAIHSFIGKMKTHLINAGSTVFTTVATAIIGPIFGTIKKVWMMLKQGWSSLKNAVKYIKDPANKGKPVGILVMEVGKIIIAGLTGAGTLILGEVIEKGLMTIPIFAFEIPLLGSLANILGIFLGAVVAGIIGAIAINLLDKLISKKQKEEVQAATIEKGNKVIAKQHQIQIVSEALLERDKENAQSNISGRHQEAASIMKDAYGNIMEDFVEDFSQSAYTSVINEEDVLTNKEIDKTSKDLDDLLGELK